MADIQLPDWTKFGTRFVHHCGATVLKQPRNTWMAETVAGNASPSFSDPIRAVEWLQANDPSFWSVGRLASFGIIAGIFCITGSFVHDGDLLNAWSVPDDEEFPAHYAAAFKRLCLRKATCAKCGATSEAIKLRRLTFVEWRKPYRGNFVVCQCGCPVWRMSMHDSFAADDGLNRAAHSRKRKLSLIEAGGKHTAKEIAEILSLQRGRCIYCDALFTETLRPTKDHLLAVIAGGSDCALNIVLACRKCNSRRYDLPFRTFCKLLSGTQNKRILAHLERRILALDFELVAPEAFASFCIGINLHEPKRLNERLSFGRTKIARRNAASNRLMPRAIQLVKRAFRKQT